MAFKSMIAGFNNLSPIKWIEICALPKTSVLLLLLLLLLKFVAVNVK